MIERVIADFVSVLDDPARDFGIATDEFSGEKDRRPDATLSQRVEDFQGSLVRRAGIEGDEDRLSGSIDRTRTGNEIGRSRRASRSKLARESGRERGRPHLLGKGKEARSERAASRDGVESKVTVPCRNDADEAA